MGPYLQNNQSKLNWTCGSSGRAPALQAEALSSNHNPPAKNKTKQNKTKQNKTQNKKKTLLVKNEYV
jgi:hypothetical protein